MKSIIYKILTLRILIFHWALALIIVVLLLSSAGDVRARYECSLDGYCGNEICMQDLDGTFRGCCAGTPCSGSDGRYGACCNSDSACDSERGVCVDECPLTTCTPPNIIDENSCACLPPKPPKVDSGGMEYDTDRGGSDYKNFDLTQADPALCQTSCSGEAQCKSWTYVKPGIQEGSKARCWLKTRVPAAKASTCCVSGVKGMEYDTDRGGSDYKNFDLTQADPALCQTSCSGEAQCKAWTYVKPGIQEGSKARCWLKTRVPAAKASTCCVSGLK